MQPAHSAPPFCAQELRGLQSKAAGPPSLPPRLDAMWREGVLGGRGRASALAPSLPGAEFQAAEPEFLPELIVCLGVPSPKVLTPGSVTSSLKDLGIR